MQGEDACGTDWTRCVKSVAKENMQNNRAGSTAGTKVSHTEKFDITDSVQEMLSSKRTICERVLDKCLASRDFVWNDFLRDVAPELKEAELKAEANSRQSCLGDISNCVQKACKDDIESKGVATMDACLARPDMARSFCKVEIDPCERMEPQIWDYVVSKLASMRVDACTKEVKDCFASEDRCGADFAQCIGMDYAYLHDMCPVDKLVVCKQSNKDFQISDIDSMLMGFFLNVDNSALEICEKKIDEKMSELCGSTVDCNKFASDDTIGAGSLQAQKNGAIYRITGMLSFGMIKVGNGVECDGVPDGEKCGKKYRLPLGKIGIKDYMAEVRKKNFGPNDSQIIDSIEAELRNIQGTIDRAVDLLDSDMTIKYCTEGRDLSQINGGGRGKDNKTTARFPNMLNSQKQLIAVSALRQAQDNYNAKFNKSVSDAMKNADLDLAQYMCQSMAKGTNQGIGGGAGGLDTELVQPYSISYDISAGLTVAQLTEGGSSTISKMGSAAADGSMQAGVLNIGYTGNGKSKAEGGIQKSSKALFSRETRNCHMCTSTQTQNCKSSGGTAGFLGIGAQASKSECTWSEPKEKCEDFQM
jgi:hypothetical protein